ncbi:hypothetical protein ERJ75_000357600 [Trypanosoma vivax]|uniref:Uncharacterized protein n=1 Tax=Trypanosoma vivax (strain Y486) TaxID=1055687 RepID=G0TZU0_TRYVY|nr:hypothetical protein TRVL_03294 [Trypanosoma vivax]KAH8617645.1 hypothetical protein ERJ75_000357600 [Trypanosoma vivax]CCC50118.1 hypothetical protein, conserved in T. vivax [Trypanosoma vivax Y486]
MSADIISEDALALKADVATPQKLDSPNNISLDALIEKPIEAPFVVVQKELQEERSFLEEILAVLSEVAEAETHRYACEGSLTTASSDEERMTESSTGLDEAPGLSEVTGQITAGAETGESMTCGMGSVSREECAYSNEHTEFPSPQSIAGLPRAKKNELSQAVSGESADPSSEQRSVTEREGGVGLLSASRKSPSCAQENFLPSTRLITKGKRLIVNFGGITDTVVRSAWGKDLEDEETPIEKALLPEGHHSPKKNRHLYPGIPTQLRLRLLRGENLYGLPPPPDHVVEKQRCSSQLPSLRHDAESSEVLPGVSYKSDVGCPKDTGVHKTLAAAVANVSTEDESKDCAGFSVDRQSARLSLPMLKDVADKHPNTSASMCNGASAGCEEVMQQAKADTNEALPVQFVSHDAFPTTFCFAKPPSTCRRETGTQFAIEEESECATRRSSKSVSRRRSSQIQPRPVPPSCILTGMDDQMNESRKSTSIHSTNRSSIAPEYAMTENALTKQHSVLEKLQDIIEDVYLESLRLPDSDEEMGE